jgi:hypothetical protein
MSFECIITRTDNKITCTFVGLVVEQPPKETKHVIMMIFTETFENIQTPCAHNAHLSGQKQSAKMCSEAELLFRLKFLLCAFLA